MTRSKAMWSSMVVALGVLLLFNLPMFAAQNQQQPTMVVNHAYAFGAGRVTEVLPNTQYGFHEANPVRRIPKPTASPTTDRVEQRGLAPTSEFNLVYHVLGVGNGFPGYTVPDAPPDTTLAVGTTEVLQWVNVSYADFNKSTGAIIPLNGQNSTLGNTIWHNLIPGTLCANHNAGDIIVKFDRMAQRWVMAQNVFTSPYAVCVAISQTATFSDNLWYAYQFPVVNSGFPDYPKWGVWPSGGSSDGYYQAWNNFGPGGSGFVGPVICGYDRAKMLAGDPSAEQICFQLSNTAPNFQDSLLPADLDSPTPPPGPEDEFFIGSLGDIDNSHLSLYSMHINTWSPANATMTGNGDTQLIAISTFTPACNGAYGGDCVPQEGTTDKLDSLGDRLMYRFLYWDDRPPNHATATPPLPNPVQHWLVNHDVTASTGSNAVRWYEFIAAQNNVPVTSLLVFQQGTYAGTTGDSNWRWMGSIARDNTYDILVGYSESSPNMFPAVAVAGRVFGDTLGTLSPEQFSVNGTGSQPDTADRWGDYSTMAIDPSDNCTFFYTTEYYMVTQTFDWSTDISSWKFPTCH
ncbi:MAG TPA: hypothetical protein VL240_03250 [Candidatus Binatia bacterium]|nr:hypothetical protein [Candidatus Binatia bacterium]